MPFCTHCGAQSTSGDRFCAHCGTAQDAGAAPAGASAGAPPASESAPPTPGPSAAPRMRPHIAALLCYIPKVGWLASVFFLTADQYRRNRYVHFHALQGLFLFVASVLAGAIFGFATNAVRDSLSIRIWPLHWGVAGAIQIAVVIIQVVGMMKTAKGEPFHIPVLGDIAERSMV